MHTLASLHWGPSRRHWLMSPSRQTLIAWPWGDCPRSATVFTDPQTTLRQHVRYAHRDPIAVRPSPPLAEMLVLTGFGYLAETRAHQAASVARLLPRVRDVRRMGSCSLDLCHVADGSGDAYVEEGPARGEEVRRQQQGDKGRDKCQRQRLGEMNPRDTPEE